GGIRTTMEAHLGTDLGGVRVHDDERSSRSAAAIGARAFAHGHDVYLGSDESPTDLGLMAHELTHVAQQTGGAERIQRKVEVGAPNSPAEQQADAVAASVTAGQSAPLLVEDAAPAGEGQMWAASFLAAVRIQVE